MAVNWYAKNLPKYPKGIGQSVMNNIQQGAPAFNQAASQGRFDWFRGPNFGGGNANYGGLIGGSPDLSALEAAYGAQSKADAASRDAALRRLVISYGGMPSLDALGMSDQARGFFQKAINPETLNLARKADEEGLTVSARQKKDDAVTRRRIPAGLAGRGMLRSGQTVSDLADQAQNFKNLQYDTLNELLGNVENTVGGFLRAEQDRAISLAQAKIQAAWAAMQNWGDYDMGGSFDGQHPFQTMAGRGGRPGGGGRISSMGGRRRGNRIMATRYIPGGRI